MNTVGLALLVSVQSACLQVVSSQKLSSWWLTDTTAFS